MTRTFALCVVVVCGCAPTPPEPRAVARPEPPDVTATPGAALSGSLVGGYFDSPELAAEDERRATELAAELEKRAADNARESSCFGPLEDACNGRCPNYDDSVAEVRRFAGARYCFQAEVGTCGDLRYTTIGHPLGAQTEYFNAAGELVAARTFRDFLGNPECPFWAHHGERVTCSKVPTTTYCAR